jgi:hypothetical protein
MAGRGWVGVLVVGALLTVAGCGDDEGSVESGGASTTTEAPDTSTTTTAAPSEVPTALAPAAPSTEAPGTWFAVEHRGDRFVLVQGSTAGGEPVDVASVADDAGEPDTSLPQSASDLAVTADGQTAYLALCCEPVSGGILSVPVDGSSEPASFDQGDSLDIGDVYVRSDTMGVLRWTVGAPTAADDVSVVDAGALDVAVDHTGGAVVAALATDGGDVASTVRTYADDGSVVDEVDLGGAHCAVVGTTDALIAAVGEPQATEHESTCVGADFTLVAGTATGATSLDVGLQDLETDASGEHLIGVDEQGNVVQVTAGDEVVPLTEGRTFVAADW